MLRIERIEPPELVSRRLRRRLNRALDLHVRLRAPRDAQRHGQHLA